MKSLLIGIAVALSITVWGGGGGGGGGDSTGDIDQPNNGSGYEIAFPDAPLAPNISNVAGDRENHEFDPEDTITIYWRAGVTKDGEPIATPKLYTASVFLSEDEVLGDDDALVFATECRSPDLGFQYHCGEYASFTCKYNEPATLTCGSIDQDSEHSFSGRVSDVSQFLDVTPKAGYVFFKVCPSEYPDACDTHTTPIMFY